VAQSHSSHDRCVRFSPAVTGRACNTRYRAARYALPGRDFHPLDRASFTWRTRCYRTPYIKVKGIWTYLYRAVDSLGQTIDFPLSVRRDAAAAKRFFRTALARPHTGNPRTITADKNPAYPKAVAEMKRSGQLWRFSRLRQCKYLNNIVEQNHRKRSVGAT
jgi:hypothetical protein